MATVLDKIPLNKAVKESKDKAQAAAIPDPPKGAPWYYYEKEGKLYDSANVPVTIEEIQGHISRNEKHINHNKTMIPLAPAAAKFAIDDLTKQNLWMNYFLGKHKGKTK